MISRYRTIGLVLSGHLGDVVLHSCILAPIRDRFPDAKLILIGSPSARQLFGDSPYVDQFVGVRKLISQFLRQHRIQPQDLLFRVQEYQQPMLEVDCLIFPYLFVSPIELILSSLIKQRKLVGRTGGPCINLKEQVSGPGQTSELRTIWEQRVTYPVPVPQQYNTSHLLDHLASFLAELGCPAVDCAGLRVHIDPERKEILSSLSLVNSFSGQPYGVLFPGVSFHRDIKMWPLDRYGMVINLLGDAGPSCWLVCGHETEHQDCQTVAQAVKSASPNINVALACGKPLRQIAAVLKNAQLAIGCDNGGTHMAVASGIPAVSIVSGAAEKLYFPWGNPAIHRSLVLPLECRGCSFDCSQPSVLCVEGITANLVADVCREVLEHDSK